MPHRLYSFDCCGQDPEQLCADRTCSSCGRSGRDEGLRLCVTELMAAYQNVYGLAPLGPHRRLADRLFQDLRAQCPTCDGRGLLDTNLGDGYLVCDDCGGTGRRFSCDHVTFLTVRRQVLDEYPGASVLHRIVNICSPTLARHLATGVVRDLRHPDGPAWDGGPADG